MQDTAIFGASCGHLGPWPSCGIPGRVSARFVIVNPVLCGLYCVFGHPLAYQ